MNTRNDFLDNAVDDGFGIDGTGDLHTEMCSSMQNDIEQMCSSMCNDKYRNNLLPEPHKLRIYGVLEVQKRRICHLFATHITKSSENSRRWVNSLNDCGFSPLFALSMMFLRWLSVQIVQQTVQPFFQYHVHRSVVWS